MRYDFALILYSISWKDFQENDLRKKWIKYERSLLDLLTTISEEFEVRLKWDEWGGVSK